MLYRCVGRARASVSVSSMSLVSLHHTPTYASWLNQVERWFGLLTDKKLRRGAHRSIQALEKDIRDWITNRNDDPKPFTWAKSADDILERLNSYLQRIPGAGR
jgi:transposase